MKFIFPQNYNFKNKIFGFIDYPTAILNVLWDVFVFCVLDLIFVNLTLKICLFIILCFPLLLFSIFGFNNENIISVIVYIFKYIKNKKLYLYRFSK